MSFKRTYSELIRLESFTDRFKYLKLNGKVGSETFGFDRYLNQMFYRSPEWRRLRREVIIRDNGCDLGIEGLEIHSDLYVHHMNPLAPQDIIEGNELALFNPDVLITTTHQTHNALHYGDERLLFEPVVSRSPGDTQLW